MSFVTVAARIVWVFPATYLPRYLSARVRARDPYPKATHVAVLSWAGMRGVVSLAAALALPENLAGRSLVIFCAFCVILTTLVVPGIDPAVRHPPTRDPLRR